MSNLAYHAQHFKAGSVGAVGKHNYEKRGAKDEHSNQDIDPNRSHLNFQPQETEGSLYLAAKKRIQEACTGRVTAASNWITETIVYPPEDVVERYKASGDDAELRRYYADVLSWHQQEFGEKNILNATVHLDETTPHMHTDLVPLTVDGKLSSKEVFSRKNLLRHHTELAKFLKEQGWDIERGQDTKGKQVRAVSVDEYKKDAEKRKAELQEEISDLQTKVKPMRELRQENLKVYSMIQEGKEKLEAQRSEIKENKETLEFLEQEIEVGRDMLDLCAERAEEARDGLEAVQGEVTTLKEQKTALTASVDALRKEEAQLKDEVELNRKVRNTEREASVRELGMDGYLRQIEKLKEQQAEKAKNKELERKVSMYEQFFLSFPNILRMYQDWRREKLEALRKPKKKDEHVL